MLGLVFIATVTVALYPEELLIFEELNEKVRHARYSVTYQNDGKVEQCLITESTGDSELDEIFCKSAEACLSLDEDQLEAEECMTSEQVRLTAAMARNRAVVELETSVQSEITLEF